jgi:hypothetical protein
MDLTPGQQRLLFVVIALVLVGLGIFLVRSHNSGGSPAAQGTPAPTPSTTTSKTSMSFSTGQPAADTPPATVPAATPVSTVGGAEIYQWLPFTPADLAAAAQATVTFTKDYATWSYTENKTAYAAKLTGLVTPTELTTLESGYSTAGVSTLRVADKQVSTGSGTIDSISSFGTGPVSITFLVTITQQVASTQPAKTVDNQYTVTVAAAGSAWQVSDIELFGLGNQ